MGWMNLFGSREAAKPVDPDILRGLRDALEKTRQGTISPRDLQEIETSVTKGLQAAVPEKAKNKIHYAQFDHQNQQYKLMIDPPFDETALAKLGLHAPADYKKIDFTRKEEMPPGDPIKAVAWFIFDLKLMDALIGGLEPLVTASPPAPPKRPAEPRTEPFVTKIKPPPPPGHLR